MRSNTMPPVFFLGAFLGLLPVTTQQPEPHYVHVQITTDSSTPITGSKVKIQSPGALTRIRMTDAGGWTQPASVTAGSLVSISLKERAFEGGLVLGQVLQHTMPVNSGLETHSLLLLSQPALDRVVFDSSALHLGQSPYHSRWLIYPETTATPYLFAADVGMLLTSREINAFEAYYGVDFGSEEYRLGVVVRTADVEPLGDGIGLAVNCSGHGFSSIPEVDTFFITKDPAAMGQAGLNVVPFELFGTSVQTAKYSVSGQLGAGFNIFLFKESSSSQSTTDLLAHEPPFGPAAQGYDPIDCTPPVPLPPHDMSCTPTDESDPECPAGTCSNPECDPAGPTLHVIATRCGDASNPPKTIRVTRKVSKSMSVSFKLTPPNVEIGAGSTGSVEDETSEDYPLAFENGAGGCGQCKTIYEYDLRCWADCTFHKYTGPLSGPLGALGPQSCRDVTELRPCLAYYQGTTPPCDRNCQ